MWYAAVGPNEQPDGRDARLQYWLPPWCFTGSVQKIRVAHLHLAGQDDSFKVYILDPKGKMAAGLVEFRELGNGVLMVCRVLHADYLRRYLAIVLLYQVNHGLSSGLARIPSYL